MNMSPFRATSGLIFALAMLSLAAPSLAQQKTAPAAPSAVQPSTAVPQPAPAPAQAIAPAQPVQAPAPSVAVPATPEAAAAPADGESKPLKSTTVALRELSPWSMFMSADIIVKAVMVGLAFASLVTWTIFIAKMIELSVIRGKLRAALAKIGEARSLAEAQLALGAKGSVLSSLLAAALDGARLSARISSVRRIQR